MISEPRDVASPKAHDLQRVTTLGAQADLSVAVQSGDGMGRKIEDMPGETTVESSVIRSAKAQATGNPLALEKIKLEYEIRT